MRCYCGCWCAAFYDAQSITIDLHIPWYVNLLCVLQRPSNFRMGSGHAGHTHSLNFNQKGITIAMPDNQFTSTLVRPDCCHYEILSSLFCRFGPREPRSFFLVTTCVVPIFNKYYTELAVGHRFRCSFVYGHLFFFSFSRVPISYWFLRFFFEKKERKSKQIFGKVFFFLIQILKIVADFNPEFFFFFCVIAHHLNGWFPSSYSNQFVHSYV